MKTGWIKQTSPQDNAAAAAANLLKLLDVPANRSTIDEQVSTHHAFPGITSISDTLEEMGVDTLTVKLRQEQLHEIGFPCIAHLSKNSGHFVVLASIDDRSLTYIDPEEGWLTVTINDFLHSWSGVMLLANKNDEAGERGYLAKKKEERIEQGRLPLAIAIIGALLIITVAATWNVQGAGLLGALAGLKLLGLVLSGLLLLNYFPSGSIMAHKLCPAGKKLNCKGVLHSPAAKLFNLVPMADLGGLYFTGSLLSLVFAVIAPALTGDMIFMLAMLNLFTLPYTLFSISYQAFVAKQWCWMCVAIQAVFWIEFAVFYSSGWLHVPPAISTHSAVMVSWAMLLPTAIWLVVRPLIANSGKTKALAEQVLRFRHNPYVLWSLLQAERTVNMGQLPVEISAGDPNAQFSITMVSQPQCPYCAITHSFIEEMLEQFPGMLRFTVRFYTFDNMGRDVARRVVELALNNEQEKALSALSEGYKIRTVKALDRWREEFTPLSTVDPATVEGVLDYHTSWAKAMSIKATPAFYLNDAPLPGGFSIYDIKPLLKLKQRELEAVAQ
jgi:protein-disulfide isomerase